MRSPERVALERTVRRRAFANLVLGLVDVAASTSARLAVEALDGDSVLLRFRDVRTLVREGGVYGFASRDFTLAVAFPEDWPFRRAAMPHPVVLLPDDFAHPNSDGHLFCLDTAGIVPARLAELIYQNLALHAGHFRLDHAVDATAAAFVRAHLRELPADPRPLRSAPR